MAKKQQRFGVGFCVKTYKTVPNLLPLDIRIFNKNENHLTTSLRPASLLTLTDKIPAPYVAMPQPSP